MSRRSSMAAATSGTAGSVTGSSYSTPTSRAMPRMPRQSPRLGVRSTSMIWSSSPSQSRRSVPTGASAGSSSRPLPSSDSPSSLAEQSMPCDSTPRSLARRIARPPGSAAPTTASGAFRPTRALGAPQTICSVSLPVLTLQTCSLSASGWRSQPTISATITPRNSGAAGAMPSTSRPAMVSRSPRAAGLSSTATHSRSQSVLIFIARLSSDGSTELLQEAQIVLEEDAQVVDAVAQHGQPLQAGAEGIAGVALGIDADVAEHFRMHHAAAQHFQPAGVLADAAALAAADHAADVDLGRRLREREIGRPEPHVQVALEEVAQELRQDALEVGEAHALVHQQAFHLVEHRRVGQVRVAAIGASRRDNPYRRPLLFHHPDLHRRGVGAQQAVGVEIERVVHRPRRVMGGDVERLEVVVVVFHLGAFDDSEADAGEQRFDALQRAGHRMQAADPA